MRRLANVAPRSAFARNVLVLASGALAGQALVVAAAPVITRLYGPADFGVFAVLGAALAVGVVASALRYDLAIPLPPDDATAANVLALSMVTLAAVSLATAAAVLAFGGEVARWAGAGGVAGYLWLLPVGMFAGGAYLVLSSWAVRQRAFPLVARTKFTQSAAQVGAQVGFGVLQGGPLGLFLGDVAGRAGGSGSLAALVLRRDRARFRGVSLAGMRAAARRYRRFPLLSAGSSVMNEAALQLPVVLLALAYGAHVAGWFALGQRVISLPMVLVGAAASQVFFGEAARLVERDPRLVRPLVLRLGWRLLLLGAAALAAVALAGPLLFEQVFGDGWREAGLYAQLLTAMFVVQFAVLPFQRTLVVMERQDLQGWWDAGRLAAIAGWLVAAPALGLAPWVAVAGYGAVMLLGYAALFALFLHSLRRAEPKEVPRSW